MKHPFWPQKCETSVKLFNYLKKTGKITDVVLNNQWVNKEIKEEIKKTLRKIKVERQLTKIYWIQQKQLKRAVHSDWRHTTKNKKSLKEM